MDDDQLAARRSRRPPPRPRRKSREESLRFSYDDDTYPVETILVFTRSGHETRAAVKVADGMWRITGCMWLRRWKGLLRAVGPGYELSLIE